MSHVFHQLYYHFAWATKNREPLVDRAWRPQLLEILNEEVKTRGGWPIRHTRCQTMHISFVDCRLQSSFQTLSDN
jgi:REP element-mobilizing transposase RayT